MTGKPVYSDLQNRKKSLPVVAALASETAAARELAALYHQEAPLSPAQLARAAALVESAGGRSWSAEETARLLTAALSALSSTTPVPRPAAELTSLAHHITHRDH